MSTAMNEEQKKEIVIQRLKQYRVERQWTLQDMARTLDLSAAHVARLEQGISKPNSLTLYRIEKRLPGILGDAA